MKIKHGGSGLMLAELLLAVMFFSFAAAICLQLFVSARQAGNDSLDLSRAAVEAQSVAECFKASSGDLEETARILGMKREGESLSLDFDGEWEIISQTGSGEAVYRARLSSAGGGDGVIRARVDVYRRDDPIFGIDVAAAEEGQ